MEHSVGLGDGHVPVVEGGGLDQAEKLLAPPRTRVTSLEGSNPCLTVFQPESRGCPIDPVYRLGPDAVWAL